MCMLQAVYGGGIIDIFDRRLLQMYMREYVGDFLFSTHQPFRFHGGDGNDVGDSTSGWHIYNIPHEVSELHDFVGMIITSIYRIFALHHGNAIST